MENSTVPESGPAFFDSRSISWDENPDIHLWSTQATDTIASCVDIKDTMDVLDFGCGTGIISFLLKDRVNSVLGLDLSPGMIKMLEHKIETKDGKNVKAVHMELHNSSQLVGYGKSGSGKFDLIVSHLAFHHIANIPEMTKVLVNCLAENGILVVSDYEVCDHSNRFHPEQEYVDHPWGLDQEVMKRTFKDAGLTDVSSKYSFSARKGFELKEGEVPGQGILDDEGRALFPFFIVMGRKNI